MTRMLGPQCHFGPGGWDCACCNEPPGKERRKARRNIKRSERNQWRKTIRQEI